MDLHEQAVHAAGHRCNVRGTGTGYLRHVQRWLAARQAPANHCDARVHLYGRYSDSFRHASAFLPSFTASDTASSAPVRAMVGIMSRSPPLATPPSSSGRPAGCTEERGSKKE